MTENLLKVVYHIIVGSRSIAHNEVYWLQLCYFGNGRFVYILIEASNKVCVIYKMNRLAGYLFCIYLCRQLYAKVEHNLEKQVLTEIVQSKKVWTSSAECVLASLKKAHMFCVRKLI